MALLLLRRGGDSYEYPVTGNVRAVRTVRGVK